MPGLGKLRNLDLDDSIRYQPEWTESVTDEDSEKAVLCSLIRWAPQYGYRELVSKHQGMWRAGCSGPLILSTLLCLPFSFLLRALECKRPGFKPRSCFLVTLDKLLTLFKPQSLHLKMEITIVLFRIMRIKQDKTSHVKSLTVSGKWDDLSRWLWLLLSYELNTYPTQSSLPTMFPSPSLPVSNTFLLVYKKTFTLKILITITLAPQKQNKT